MRRYLLVICLMFTGVLCAETLTPAQLLERIRSEKADEQQLMQEREQRFLENREQQQELHRQAMQDLRAQEQESERLRAEFEDLEKQLVEREAELKERSGELGELFAVLRQGAGDIAGQWQGSLLNIQQTQRIAALERFANSRRLPSAEEIEQLWIYLLEDLIASGKVEKFSAPVVSVTGERNTTDVFRVGPFSAFSAQDYLVYKEGDDALHALPKQPGNIGVVTNWANSGDGLAVVPVDPTRGGLLEQLQMQPTFFERVQQGGLVGWVIMLLGVAGFILASWRMLYLQKVVQSVRVQMRDLSSPLSNNPLGRVLSVLGPQPQVSDLETLELKLDEAIMQEVPQLESGQGLIKLIAAVAPLLGLLGTVTGMIITFQAITQAGGGDARLMADGISQALVTTVQGLVVAVPMLFLHSIVAARSKGVIHLLEQQCVGLLALRMSARAERD